MKAKIIKIDPLRRSRAEKSYMRVYFTLEDGSWAKTDIVPAYRNYRRWKPILDLFLKGANIYIDGIVIRSNQEVDADSPIEITMEAFKIQKVADGTKVIQESLI